MFAHVFALIVCVLGLVNIILAVTAFYKKDDIGTYIGVSLLLVDVLSYLYLGTVFSSKIRVIIILSSFYYIAIDVLVFLLSLLVFKLVDFKNKKVFKIVKNTALIWMTFDAVLFVLNIFKQYVITFEMKTTTSFPRFVSSVNPIYFTHLLFSYILIAITIYVLIDKARKTPRSFRGYFINLVVFIVSAVILNAIYVFLPTSEKLDVSIIAFSLIGIFVYWNYFFYRSKKMPHKYRETILDNVNEGIALFDYNGKLIMKNKRIFDLFGKDDLSYKTNMEEFCEKYNINVDLDSTKSTFRVYTNNAAGSFTTLVGNYRRVYDGRHVSGHMFTFADSIVETDSLTGFINWDYYKKNALSGKENYGYPLSIIGFAVNNLTSINNKYNREFGDRVIALLADTIRASANDTTDLIRYRDAKLIAILRHVNEEETKEFVNKVKRYFAATQNFECEVTFQYGFAAVKNSDVSIVDAVHEAFKTLSNWKLMSSESKRSELVSSLRQTLRECDNETEEHVSRTQTAGRELGKVLGLSNYELSKLALLCVLHDIGKVGIPLEILNKPGKLTEAEWQVMRDHSRKGYHIAMSSPALEGIAEEILCHHERWDGKGYPLGLSGEDIPLLSRIIAVVDAYDAMTSDRVYRSAMSQDEAIKILRENAGTQFDPTVTEAYINLLLGKSTMMRFAMSMPSVGLDEITEDDAEKSKSDIDNDHVKSVEFSQYTVNDNGLILYADNNFYKLTGYTVTDVENGINQFEDIIPTEDSEIYRRQVEECQAKSPLVIMEHRIKCKDGTTLMVQCTGERRFDPVSKLYNSFITIVPKL